MRELVLIANTVNEAIARPEVDACIVTHGTFTTEETAAFLNYTVNSRKPVVVAASQRRHGSIGNDGDWNLWDAVRVAASPEAAGKGVDGHTGRTNLSGAGGDQRRIKGRAGLRRSAAPRLRSAPLKPTRSRSTSRRRGCTRRSRACGATGLCPWLYQQWISSRRMPGRMTCRFGR